jgi:hypothetical protein
MRKWALVAVTLCLAGCSTDSAKSLSRDYRSMINECIDGLMITTNEGRALYVRAKIFKPLGERVQVLDKRFDTWAQNTEDKLVAEDTISSESVMILIAEKKINQERLRRELDRLKKLVASKVQDETERRRQIGDNAPVDPEKDWPNLHALSQGEGMGQLVNTLLGDRGTKFHQILGRFDTDQNWKKHLPKNWDEARGRFYSRVAALGLNPNADPNAK